MFFFKRGKRQDCYKACSQSSVSQFNQSVICHFTFWCNGIDVEKIFFFFLHLSTQFRMWFRICFVVLCYTYLVESASVNCFLLIFEIGNSFLFQFFFFLVWVSEYSSICGWIYIWDILKFEISFIHSHIFRVSQRK